MDAVSDEDEMQLAKEGGSSQGQGRKKVSRGKKGARRQQQQQQQPGGSKRGRRSQPAAAADGAPRAAAAAAAARISKALADEATPVVLLHTSTGLLYPMQ
jgi:hypothetical protein